MIIVCDNCGTRFHLADGRIGPKGAKVRCSSCHHRFHVSPPTGADPPPAAENSAPAAPEEPAAVAAGSAEPDLDNPEFLFDDGDVSMSDTSDTLADGFDMNAVDPEVSLSGEVTQMHDLPEGDEADPFGEPRAPTPVFGVDPDVSARQEELTAELDFDAATTGTLDPEANAELEQAAADPDFGAGRSMDVELGTSAEAADLMPAEASVSTGPSASAEPSLESAQAGAEGTLLAADDIDDAIASALDDEIDDDTLAGWDPLADPAVAAAAERSAKRRAEASAELTPPSRASSGSSVVERVTELEDAEAASEPVWQRALVATIALLLCVGALRVTSQLYRPRPGPEQVRGAGWAASGVRVQTARDAAGERVLVVVGDLAREGGDGLPRIHAVTVDREGRPLGEPVPGLLLERGAPPLDPQVHRLRLAAGPRRLGPGQVGGFEVVIAEPDPAARRVRVQLDAAPLERPGPRMPVPVTDADAPVAAEARTPGLERPAASGPEPSQPAAAAKPE